MHKADLIFALANETDLTQSEAEAQVNFQDLDGNTPLHYAAIRSHQDIWELLVSRGENPNIQNIEGMTALALRKRMD